MTELNTNNSRVSLHKKLIENYENSLQDTNQSQIFNKGKKYKYENLNEHTPIKVNHSVKNRRNILPTLNRCSFKNSILNNKKQRIEKGDGIKTELDSILDKKLKGIIDETVKLQENNEETNTSEEEKEVLNLNFWEIDHLNDDSSGNSESNVSNVSLLSKKSELEGLNFHNSEQKKIKKKGYKGKHTIKTMSDQRDEEKSILDEKKNEFYDVSICKKLENLKKSTHFLGFSENVIKKINFHLKGDVDTISKPGHYRDIIKSKQNKENEYREELFRIGHKLIDKKSEKRRLINDITITTLKFQKFQSKTQDSIDKLDALRQNLNQLFTNIVSSNNIDILHRMPNVSRDFYNSVCNSFSYENRRFLVREKIELIEKELDQMFLKLNSEKNKSQIFILEAKKQIRSIDKEKKLLKLRFKDLCKEQRIYYLDILKKGLDVRDEGLVWVVRRLTELNSRIEYSSFPRFLENSQIDYLIMLAQKQMKSYQKKIILKTLKEKQKKLRDEENTDKFMGVSKNSFHFNKTNKSKFFLDSNQTSKSFNKTILSNKTMMEFDKIYTKYDKMIKKTFEKKMEDLKIQGVIDSMKETMKTKNNDNEHLGGETNIDKYFSNNKKQKEYFEEILILRREIEALEKEYHQLKEEQLVFFKQKYENGSFNKNKNNVQYDLIYSALFGNNICF